MSKEEILDKVAVRMMHEWSINKFKLSHKRLFDVIMESMDEYAGEQVKKLNIDDVSKRFCDCKEPYEHRLPHSQTLYCSECEKDIQE